MILNKTGSGYFGGTTKCDVHENPSGESRPDSADRLTCQRSQWFCERGQLCGACTVIGTADVAVQRCAVIVLCVR